MIEVSRAVYILCACDLTLTPTHFGIDRSTRRSLSDGSYELMIQALAIEEARRRCHRPSAASPGGLGEKRAFYHFCHLNAHRHSISGLSTGLADVVPEFTEIETNAAQPN